MQAHSDDVPLMASGTVAKLIEEGYTGYLLRATNDDMGDAPGLGTAGSVGEHVLGRRAAHAVHAQLDDLAGDEIVAALWRHGAPRVESGGGMRAPSCRP